MGNMTLFILGIVGIIISCISRAQIFFTVFMIGNVMVWCYTFCYVHQFLRQMQYTFHDVHLFTCCGTAIKCFEKDEEDVIKENEEKYLTKSMQIERHEKTMRH